MKSAGLENARLFYGVESQDKMYEKPSTLWSYHLK
jgi:hypothetical protein